MKDSQFILKIIFDFYIKSSDYNGILLSHLSEQTKIEYIQLIEIIKELVISDKVSVQNGINPHIISLCHFPKESQLAILEEAKNNEIIPFEMLESHFSFKQESYKVCAYPSSDYLKRKRDISQFLDQPYKSQLLMGEPQLKPIFFNIEVLERYFKDPRYAFKFGDYSGQISCNEDENGNLFLNENDQVFIKTFGLGFNEKREKVAVVYLYYLGNLSSEHQYYWKSKEIKEKCVVSNEYFRNTIAAEWTNSYSIFSGFIGEQKSLNDLSNLIFRKSIFRETFSLENRPKEFTFFFFPTLKNYLDFVSLLDKMISENINKNFFKNTNVELYTTKLVNGHIEKQNKGTIKLFQEWLTKNINPETSPEIIELFNIFSEIRKERQYPAHKINSDIYDKSYSEKQIELIIKAYKSMRSLRQIFQNHPKAKDFAIEKWLDEGEIKVF